MGYTGRTTKFIIMPAVDQRVYVTIRGRIPEKVSSQIPQYFPSLDAAYEEVRRLDLSVFECENAIETERQIARIKGMTADKREAIYKTILALRALNTTRFLVIQAIKEYTGEDTRFGDRDSGRISALNQQLAYQH